jgi:hypothetical protein
MIRQVDFVLASGFSNGLRLDRYVSFLPHCGVFRELLVGRTEYNISDM